MSSLRRCRDRLLQTDVQRHGSCVDLAFSSRSGLNEFSEVAQGVYIYIP